jgi:putative oxidoreductase
MAFSAFLGRVLLSSIFLGSMAGKFKKPEENMQMMEQHQLPANKPLLYSAAATELAGGLSILTGVDSRLGALMLFLYMIPTTLFFHTDFKDQNQQFHFMKNLAIMGGLLMVVAYDSRQSRLLPA